MGVASHLLFHNLLVRSKSWVPPTLKGRASHNQGPGGRDHKNTSKCVQHMHYTDKKKKKNEAQRVDETSPLTRSQVEETWNSKPSVKNSEAHDLIHKYIIQRSNTALTLSWSLSPTTETATNPSDPIWQESNRQINKEPGLRGRLTLPGGPLCLALGWVS